MTDLWNCVVQYYITATVNCFCRLSVTLVCSHWRWHLWCWLAPAGWALVISRWCNVLKI